MVILGYLKHIESDTSAFVAEENIRMFENILKKLKADTNCPVEDVWNFLLGLHYYYDGIFDKNGAISPSKYLSHNGPDDFSEATHFRVRTEQQCRSLIAEFNILVRNK